MYIKNGIFTPVEIPLHQMVLFDSHMFGISNSYTGNVHVEHMFINSTL